MLIGINSYQHFSLHLFPISLYFDFYFIQIPTSLYRKKYLITFQKTKKMKKIILLIITILNLAAINAQSPLTQYGFSTGNDAYRSLDLDYTNYTEIDALEDWSAHPISIGFDFKLGEKTFSQINALTDGELNFEDFIIYPDNVSTLSVFAANLIDKDVNTSENSTLRYVLDGNEGNRIFKIEYQNMGFSSGTSTDKTNFQIWLYEENNQIEYRYGNSEILDMNAAFGGVGGIVAGIFELYFNDETYSGILLKNDVLMPDTTILDSHDQLSGLNLIGVPSEGTVYTFCPEGGDCSEVATSANELIINSLDLRIFPNPAIDEFILSFDLKEKSFYQIEIFNVIGRRVNHVISANPISGFQTLEIPTRHLRNGIYLCKIKINGKVITKKIKVIK